MKFTDLSPPHSPSLDQQREALQKGLGRAVQWAQAGRLADDLLLDACLHDKRYDRQFEDNRGDWLWGILQTRGAVERFRTEILQSFQLATTERDAEQLSQLALCYAKAGDDEFKTQLYRLVEQKPVADCPWIGEGQLLSLDGEEAFRFIVRIRGKLLERREWDWDDSAIVDRAIEKFGEQCVTSVLDDSTDSAISHFAMAWRNSASPPVASPRQSHVERMRAISVREVIEAVQGMEQCYWLQGWGKHADVTDLKAVLEHLWTLHTPSAIAKLLRVFGNRALPAFDPRLIEMCKHADPDVQRRAYIALKCNTDPFVRTFAIAELQKGVNDDSVVSLFINNYKQGDEHRICEAMELPEDACVRHSLLMDVTRMLENNTTADCSQLGVIVYALTPCDNCRFRAARLLHDRHVVPPWLTEERRHDSNDDSRTLVGHQIKTSTIR